MRVFAVLTVGIASAWAMAFDDFDQKVANIDVLRDKNVQKELGITEGQRKTMNDYADKFNKAGQAKAAEYQKAKKPVDMAFQKYASDQHEILRNNVLKTLSPGQTKRLREITLQAVGPRALMDPNVATKVGMSKAEYQKFYAAIMEGDQKIAKIKGEVASKIRAKYKDQKQPKTKKEADDLNARLNKDLEAEMHKHDAEFQATRDASEKKTQSIVKKQYLEALKALMGKPFNPGGAKAPKTSGKKGG